MPDLYECGSVDEESFNNYANQKCDFFEFDPDSFLARRNLSFMTLSTICLQLFHQPSRRVVMLHLLTCLKDDIANFGIFKVQLYGIPSWEDMRIYAKFNNLSCLVEKTCQVRLKQYH